MTVMVLVEATAVDTELCEVKKCVRGGLHRTWCVRVSTQLKPYHAEHGELSMFRGVVVRNNTAVILTCLRDRVRAST